MLREGRERKRSRFLYALRLVEVRNSGGKMRTRLGGLPKSPSTQLSLGGEEAQRY